MKTFEKKSKWILMVIVIILIFLTMFLMISNWLEKDKNKNYPLAVKNSFFSGEIERINLNRGTIFILLTNKKSFKTIDSRNYDYNPIFIDDFLTIGDSIVKPLDSDTLYVIRDKKQYYFVLGEFVNEKSKK